MCLNVWNRSDGEEFQVLKEEKIFRDFLIVINGTEIDPKGFFCYVKMSMLDQK